MTREGFTLLELVLVLALVGILAVFAYPRLVGREFDERGFRDQVLATVQHARRLAVAARRYTCVTVAPGTGTSATVSISRDPTAPESVGTVNCSVALPLPQPGAGCAASNQVCAPGGVSLSASPASFAFDPLGRAVDSSKAVLGSAPTLTVSNQPAITVTPETGVAQ
ncbi:MAG: prepilin-type N-terminal cleavage/methylation domain-containing protein [Burkholderiales bacterium]|nr:prepilin-type N-terminal cleavage/methylation domain-containing protein [Burkholderiales bacterium]MDW8469718.1 prepilin-type N-terminal cleavage/methylation domain-containing protein [Burkholderiales bacterium]